MQDSALVAFYRGHGRDHRGRLLSHILGFSFDELEFHHDYIQWLFPLPEPSGVNPDAPLLSAGDIACFTSDQSLRTMLLRSFELMVQFYGLDLHGGDDPSVVRGPNFVARRNVWLTRGNHNFLRISRMLRSLTLLGCARHACAFLDCLEEIHAQNSDTVGQTTVGHWRRAVAV